MVLASGISLICVLTTAAHLRVVLTSVCAISLTQAVTAVLCVGHVILTGLDYETWWPLSDEPGNDDHTQPDDPMSMRVEVLKCSFPVAFAYLSLVIAINSFRVIAATVSLRRRQAELLALMARTGRPMRTPAPPGLRGSLPEREGGRRGPWTPLLHQRVFVDDDAGDRAPPPRYVDSLSGSINGPPTESAPDSDVADEQMTAAELVLIEGDPPSYNDVLAEE